MTTDGHGGNRNRLAQLAGKAPDEILDFSANINPLGPPDWLRPVISRHLGELVHYPDSQAGALVAATSRRYGAAADEILSGNGSTELLYLLAQVAGTKRAVIPVPCYTDYARAARLAGMELVSVPIAEKDGFQFAPEQLAPLLNEAAAVFIGRPNNPTGQVCHAPSIRTLAQAHPECLFIVDEAFGDFVEDFESLTTKRPPNVVVLLSLTKIFAIPGLRLGCAVADAALAGSVRARQPPWSVNTLAQAVGVAALGDTDYVARSRSMVRGEREALLAELRRIQGLVVYPGAANFLLVRLDLPAVATLPALQAGSSVPDARILAQRLLSEDGIAIRVCANFEGLDARFFRVAVRTADENARLIAALHRRWPVQRVLNGRKAQPKTRRTPAIMFQGVSSNAGKSVMTAAFCRLLLQDGFRVAPFKAQNMSLNSFVTRAGGEMGRAQVVQAQACRVEPDVRMNPVLLKPNSDTGAQVILLGKPVGNMTVNEYIRYKPEAFKTVTQAYDSLAAEYDAIVLEGAGSPAEVNLKHHDIVNMAMAQYARARVLLVGDIDRGGVFASFVGTLEVLAEWERALVAGFVVNRFRGQEELLHDALDYTERHTGKPVFGVVPYLANLNLPEEDSVTFKSRALDQVRPGNNNAVEIAIIDLPHVSNFTDFDPFRMEHDVHLRIIRAADELCHPDAIIIPGSKNTLGDLAYLKHSGLAERIVRLAAEGKTEIVGICGGFQMIGKEIRDPQCVESSAGTAAGLELLDVQTVMAVEKTLLRASARHALSGLEVQGYEIHHGQTCTATLAPILARPDGEVVGMANADGRIWGTYLHGVFDADLFRRWFIDRLRIHRGMAAEGRVMAVYSIEPALEQLAQIVRRSLKMDAIYRLMGL
ncbi:MAG: cobyric acid synthase [Verrucomicrobia bacterium]|nr:cobyric acid synthase [Verrucomicrobiota bacterium]